MQELLEEAIIGTIRNLSFSGLINLWGTTVLATLSSCSIFKVLLIGAYLAVLKLSNWKRLLANVFMFVLGTSFAYLFLGIIVAVKPSWIRLLVPGSSILYISVGLFLIAFGLVALGFFGTPFPWLKLLSRRDPEHDYFAAFLLGATVILVEALSCPICNPTLKLVSAVYQKQGPVFASLISGTLVLGGSTLPLITGIILSPLKQLLDARSNREYIQIAGAIIMILVGLSLIWLF